jgi:hypothetical protein
MNDDKNHMNYSTDYLRKYLNGELTDKEMQALEKAALEDPFLSDAIDGLEEAGRHLSSFESDVNDLKKRITERIQKEKRKRGVIYLFPRWQIAASILIMVSIATLTITLLKNNSRQHTVSVVNKKDTEQITAQPPPAAVQVEPDTIAETIKTSSHNVAVNSKRVDTKKTMTKQTRVESPVSSDVLQDKETTVTKPQASASVAMQEKVKTVDTLKTDTNAMKQLNEVVVTGYAAQKKKDITGATTVVTYKKSQPSGITTVTTIDNSQPAWQAMNNYINENKKINNADSVLKGEEIISFQVNKRGKLSSFKVIKSISSSHDAECIRLLKSGPPLRSTNGKKQKYQISIFFN